MAPRRYLESIRRHLVEDVAAWWERAADDRDGGVFSCWSNDGDTLVSRDKYVWSQGRWAWLMARYAGAARAGLLPLDAEQLPASVPSGRPPGCATSARLPDGSHRLRDRCRRAARRRRWPGRGFHTSIFADLFAALGFAARRGRDRRGGVAGAAPRSCWHPATRASRPGRCRPSPTRRPRGFKGLDLPMILVGVGHRGASRDALDGLGRHRAPGPSGRMERHRARRGEDRRDDPRRSGRRRHAPRPPPHAGPCARSMLVPARRRRHRCRRACVPPSRSPRPCPVLPTSPPLSFDLGWDDEQGGLLRYVDKDGGEPRGRRIGERPLRGAGRPDLGHEAVVAQHRSALHDAVARPAHRSARTSWSGTRGCTTTSSPPSRRGPGREWIQIRDRAGRPLDQTVALPVKDPFHVARACSSASSCRSCWRIADG